MQLKQNIEQEVENMENEIVRLKAQLEGDIDLEEAEMSDEETVAGDSGWCEKIVFVAASSNELSDLAQKSVPHSGHKTDLLNENVHSALEVNCESGRSLQHEAERNMSQVCVDLTSEPSGVVFDLPPAHDNQMSLTPFSAASQTEVCKENAQQAVVSDAKNEMLTTSQTECWSDLSANTLRMLCEPEPVVLLHDMNERPFVDMMVHDDTNFDREETPADMAVRNAVSLVKDGACSMSDTLLADVCGAAVTQSKSCTQLRDGGGLDDQESVTAVPDSLDEIAASCDGGAEDDTSSCMSCEEDIVVPDSEDDLFSSQYNADVASAAALTSCLDESKYFGVSNIREQFDEVCSSVKLVTVQSSALVDHATANSFSGSEKNGQGRSGAKSNVVNRDTEFQGSHRTDSSYISNEEDSDNVMKHKFSTPADSMSAESHLSGTIDTVSELHQQLPTASVVLDVLPKRPHWTFVVSGISQSQDQVIVDVN